MEIEWLRIEAGEYESKDERFHIVNVWDRFYGNHWSLLDRNDNRDYQFDSLKQCKRIAEELIKSNGDLL